MKTLQVLWNGARLEVVDRADMPAFAKAKVLIPRVVKPEQRQNMDVTTKSEADHWADSNRGSLNLLLETHFPGYCEVDNIEPGKTMVEATDAGTVTRRKLEWAIGSFEQYNSSGPDGIFPPMLQKAVHVIIP